MSNCLWCCQVSFKLFDKLSDMQAIRECVMHVDGDWHCEAFSGFRDLSKRNQRRGVSGGQIPCMGDGREIEPRQHRKPDQVLPVVSLQIVSALHPLQFDRGFSHKGKKLRLVGIVSESDGPIRPSDGASAMDGRVSPYRAIDEASLKVFDLIRCDQCAVNKCQKYRDTRPLGETIRLSAIDSQTDPVKGFVERTKELEKFATLPRFQVNLDCTGTALLKHDCFIVIRHAAIISSGSLPVQEQYRQGSDERTLAH